MTITTGTQIKANGKIYQCYNVTADTYHFGQVGKNGAMLAPNANTLLNLPKAQVDYLAQVGAITD